MHDPDAILETAEQLIRLRIPNFLRLYLNPWVGRTCVVLSELVRQFFPSTSLGPRYPTFLANSGEEALSGAIKLTRFSHYLKGQTGPCSVALLGDRWPVGFAELCLSLRSDLNSDDSADARLELIPAVHTLSPQHPDRLADYHTVVIRLGEAAESNADLTKALQSFRSLPGRQLIVVTESTDLQSATTTSLRDLSPDIVVFDESYTQRQVPFGAFSARPDLYAAWMKRGMSAFHSTTFQPNTISTAHFLKCMELLAPQLMQNLHEELEALLLDHRQLRRTYRELFSPSLERLITAAGFDEEEVTAAGHYVRVGSRRLFDGIGGVACSLRGHNPEDWQNEIRDTNSMEARDTVQRILNDRTGLRHHVPAVSGASAAENALRMALAAQWPRKHVLVLRGGFGGKTLLALTGTEKRRYRIGIDPIYPHVSYLNPFSSDAVDQLNRICREKDIAVIQLELIQGVGGVREIPTALLEAISELRRQQGFAVFVDEIQTGMFRTGPFLRSAVRPLTPDFITIGKGVSDMMFPFALTLYSDRMQYLMQTRCPELPQKLSLSSSYETGYRCLLNTLLLEQHQNLEQHVYESGAMFRVMLREHIGRTPLVRDIRAFGLLIGIELDVSSSLPGRAGLNIPQLVMLKMMNDPVFPLLMGFCQYEPNVLKFTPPLSIRPEEVELCCRTIASAVKTSPLKLITTALKAGVRLLRR